MWRSLAGRDLQERLLFAGAGAGAGPMMAITTGAQPDQSPAGGC